jgi:hypothetical protein
MPRRARVRRLAAAASRTFHAALRANPDHYLAVSFVSAALALPASAPAPALAAELSEETTRAAVAALGAGLEVERDLLKTQQELYRQTAADRDATTRRLQGLLVDLDAMVLGTAPAPAEVVAGKEKEIGEAETRRLAAIQKCREILGRIQEVQERAAGLEKKLVSLKEGLPKGRESLTGKWNVTYLPSTSRGVFVLRQTGTIVQGQYQLDGGWKGSLQGTFIDGKIYMQRIDSKLGRSSELEGFLSSDGASIRGTWRNYNLTDGGTASGSWTASRQEE